MVPEKEEMKKQYVLKSYMQNWRLSLILDDLF